jgi:hypothetical protein
LTANGAPLTFDGNSASGSSWVLTLVPPEEIPAGLPWAPDSAGSFAHLAKATGDGGVLVFDVRWEPVPHARVIGWTGFAVALVGLSMLIMRNPRNPTPGEPRSPDSGDAAPAADDHDVIDEMLK